MSPIVKDLPLAKDLPRVVRGRQAIMLFLTPSRSNGPKQSPSWFFCSSGCWRSVRSAATAMLSTKPSGSRTFCP
eukprot:8553119-Alexandrium_andersonii.AAC.1